MSKISNWFKADLGQNDPKPSTQAEIFIDTKITMETSLLIYFTSVYLYTEQSCGIMVEA